MKRRRYLTLLACSLLACIPSRHGHGQDLPVWRNPDRSVTDRTADLVRHLTAEEKISLLHFENPAIDRLGIPAYNWWNEALHGVARTGRATVFPQAINLAATWDDALVLRVATAISDEARAKFNEAQRIGNRGQYAGLTFWSPNINIFRDLRWGRGHETYGEDPTLTTRIGTAFVRGMQGDVPGRLKAAACAKHLAVHSGPETGRHGFDALTSPKDLSETYLPAFEALVREAEVACVMCSYNRINGIPACGNADLLTTTLRQEWGFDGYVVSDCGAIGTIFSHHRYVDRPEEAAALALKAGVTINCGGHWIRYLAPALEQGLISEADLDGALASALPTLFRLGLFDAPEQGPWASLDPAIVGSQAHTALAREAAAESIVLLKNTGVLPIRPDLPALAVIGPTAISADVLLGNYSGLHPELTTPLEGITSAVSAGTSIEYHVGVDVDRGHVEPGSWPVTRSQTAEAIIAVIGLSPLMEGEQGESVFIDESSAIELPRHQVDLIRALRDGYAKPLVVVVTGGSPRAIAEIHDLADAVLWIGYPGQAGGHALADVLFGRANPSGRLPVTVPFSTEDVPAYDSYDMEGRTYRYQSTDPLYPFGFGLSYTKFRYEELRLAAATVSGGENLEASVRVRNIGDRPGEEVVQLYLTDLEASVRTPRASLVGFVRLRLEPGEADEVRFSIPAERMRVFGSDGRPFFEPGAFRVTAGPSSPGPRSVILGAPEAVSAEFELTVR